MNNKEKTPVKIDFSFIYFLVICLLTLVVVSESLVIVNLFPGKASPTAPTAPAVPTVGQKTTQSMATMSVVWEKQPVSSEASRGGSGLAKIVFDSPKVAVSGADAILTFDPELVKIGKMTPNADLFNQIFANRTQEATGKIKITAYLPKKPLVGLQTLATFNFEFLTNKAAVLGLEFTAPGLSADSNLVSWESQQDILSRAVPLKVEP